MQKITQICNLMLEKTKDNMIEAQAKFIYGFGEDLKKINNYDFSDFATTQYALNWLDDVYYRVLQW